MSPEGGLTRRSLMRWSGVAGMTALGASLLPGVVQPAAAAAAPEASMSSAGLSAVPAAFDPIRPPAVPLAVRSPYLSAWLPADNSAGTWPTFWTGRTTAMTGLAVIDGVPYLFLGAPNMPGHVLRGMVQRSLEITATRSHYLFEAGGVELDLTFLSPVEPGDLRRQSMPLSYLRAQVRSTDDAAHDVALYFDISGEWAHANSGTRIHWSRDRLTGAGGTSVTSLSFAPDAPRVLGEDGDMAAWGDIVWSATERAGLSWQIGSDTAVRTTALKDGKLADTSDPNQPRAISDNWPVFAFHFDFGSVHDSPESALLSVGHVREPAISYLGSPLPPLWRSYWPSWREMVAFFHADAETAAERTTALDRRVRREAVAAGGPKYAALCALSLRQAYAGTELVSRNGEPWAFLKEISSDGNVSTVDVTYPAMPVFLYTDPAYLGLLLAPVLDYAEQGGWPKSFAEHDLGSSYPNATGHNDGNEEDMPIEESANMLIMSAAYLMRTPAETSRAFAVRHYAVLKQWADYLVDNTLDPGYQNQTDDFTGFIGHSVNLALKGILAIGAMSRLATAAGKPGDAAQYRATAEQYIAQWAEKAQDDSGDHLKLAYDQPGTWSLKYNGYPDALLGLGLVPDAVTAREARWYGTQVNQFGVPMDIRHSYTKGDWEMWTAAWLRDHDISRYLVDALYDFAHTSPSRAAFTDWYDTVTNRQNGFQARPVVGGVYALLTLHQHSGD
ncbi:glutaminase family protein [Streptacidiphilus griseoplanus]|uniref:glutaminase family protein n=1 Tax=Peterkaempfera griseoplana TaxID=66896 RepID=UPI001FE20CEE|nr:glutaminase family protein [Peterkaempfera griseoplana]